MLKIILIITVISIFAYAALLSFIAYRHHRQLENETNWLKVLLIGFIAYFFDALGIGSFATTTTMVKIFQQIQDISIPGTLNIGYTFPTLLESFIYVKNIPVDPMTLITMIITGIAGSWFGAAIVTKLSEHKVQFAMGIALIVAAILMLAGQLHLMPLAGYATGLTGYKLLAGIIGSFIIGSLSAIGIGYFAPCMALVFFLGLSARVAFPIMMGACAFVLLTAALKFLKERSYNLKAVLAFAFSGSLGVLLATSLVTALPLNILSWLVIIVIVYAAIMMLKSAAALNR